ncbi:beclin 1-associated autophagy-related key regulator-like isoform X1 [Penaeus monodon]|uniref:beclin 1-associated autophagy-related key regulator-like isoform X1 n=1 Tax=Penaeus monodon TaxID=6687 RepID=UPI0018A7BB3F|nr:beclin 1-associated autophagy-related key regulator-like isoform X1 [Penaeus monodon]
MSSLTSSDDLTPPLFQVASNVEGYGARDNTKVERCPLCNQKTEAFYCKECVRNGNFYHSRMKLPERYADKKLRYYRLRKELLEQEEEVTRLHQTKTRHLLLKERIKEVQERVSLLKLVIDSTKEDISQVKTQSAELSNTNAMRRQQLPLFQQRLSKMRKILHQYQEKIRDKREQLAISEAQLKGVVRGNIRQLTRYIFPITEVQPARSVDTDPEHLDTVSAIAEASQTTYVRGRWVYTDTSHETQYRIVHPMLPGSGDYSAYNLLSVGASGGECEEGDGEERSGGYSICAGLTYLTQLVNTLAFYLDVTLPKKLCYSEFCRNELGEQQFARRVARLNTNIIYLCLSQNVPAKLLRPTHSMPNLLALLDTQIADLGRQGSFEIAESLLESMEDGMEDDNAEGSDSEEEEDTDTLSAEWETVPNLPLLEPPLVPTHQTFSTFNSTAVYSQATMGHAGPGMGMGTGAGGIVSSAAASVISLFRGFGGTQNK